MIAAGVRHRHVGRRYQLVFWLLTFASSVLAQSPPTQEFQMTYPVSATGEVRVRTMYGNIHVTGWDRAEVKVDAIKRANTREILASAEVVVQKYTKGLCIGTKYTAAHNIKEWFGLTPDYCRDPPHVDADPQEIAAVDYTVSVPRGATLVILVDAGDVNLEDTTEYAFVNIEKGKLTARDIAGDCKLYGSYSGVNVTLDVLPRDTHIQTAVGPLVVNVSPNLSARVRAHAGRGVANDFGWQNRAHEELEGSLGDGRTLLELDNGGRIEIRRLSPPAPPVPPKMKTAPRPQPKSH